MELHLYLFYDDFEEIVVSAKSKEDAFLVVKVVFGGLKTLISYNILAYPDNFEFERLNKKIWAKDVATKYGRCVYGTGIPGTFKKPLINIILFGDENAV